MGFCEAASITVPDTESETYVVISMQPLSEIRNGRATAYRHLLICDLTVKRSARAKAHPAPAAPTALPGPLQGLLRAASRSGSIEQPPRYSAIKMSDSHTDKCRRGKFAAFTAIVLLRCRPRYV